MFARVVATAGGKVHLDTPTQWGPPFPFPQCRTGASMRRGTRYVRTDGAVTCKRCRRMEEFLTSIAGG